MIDIINKRCEEPNCMKIPSYGNPEDKLPKFCKDHSS